MTLAPQRLMASQEDIDAVRADSCKHLDFLHIVKARGEWKLFHVVTTISRTTNSRWRTVTPRSPLGWRRWKLRPRV